MRNAIKSQHTVTEEELQEINAMDWDSYYRESLPEDMEGLSNCPECNAIILIRDKNEETACYKCGRLIKK
jgi:hypothetical protein